MKTKRIEQVKELLKPKPKGGVIISVNGKHYATTYNDSEGFLEIDVSSERAAQALVNISK